MTISIVLQGILAFLFLTLGLQKISGNKLQVDIFKSLRLPQWFRIVTGWVQLIGVLALVIGIWLPWTAVFAGGWLGITMLVGSATHIRVRDPISKVIPSLVLAAVAITVLILNLS
ncbi:DoxX family protein [Bacillus horti]|uniref:Membrane protein YphA (DoxX/SURF4 family) n=1 Tax=Caldalkalibacillus horti TaxID=77523 RepID=A0ABT9W4Q6_9BACI|nr:DoxX family protein [Bacillus horti]MDQ0168224.1 putative membrane protein YphA (DoxX/SURF4 family) [Bacillus horti]